MVRLYQLYVRRHCHNISVAGLFPTLPFSLWSLMNLFEHFGPTHSNCRSFEGGLKREIETERGRRMIELVSNWLLWKFEFWMGLFYTRPLEKKTIHPKFSIVFPITSWYFLVDTLFITNTSPFSDNWRATLAKTFELIPPVKTVHLKSGIVSTF